VEGGTRCGLMVRVACGIGKEEEEDEEAAERERKL
jgi:hypothetical protein